MIVYHDNFVKSYDLGFDDESDKIYLLLWLKNHCPEDITDGYWDFKEASIIRGYHTLLMFDEGMSEVFERDFIKLEF